MTHREQLIQELQETPDVLIEQLLNYLHRLKEQEKNLSLLNLLGFSATRKHRKCKQVLRRIVVS
jgi:hypothetical protein